VLADGYFFGYRRHFSCPRQSANTEPDTWVFGVGCVEKTSRWGDPSSALPTKDSKTDSPLLGHDTVGYSGVGFVEDEFRRLRRSQTAKLDTLQTLIEDLIQGTKVGMVGHEFGDIKQRC